MNRQEVLRKLKSGKVRFLRMQFTDVMGINKNVEVPNQQFEKAVKGQILFDGSSIEGFVRIEESDMKLLPDLDTLAILPWEEAAGQGKVARLICDIVYPDGSKFPGCPRAALRRQIARAKKLGFSPMVGPEAEFFLFQKGPDGEATNITHDSGGYFDLAPIDRGEVARRAMVNILESMGFEIEAAHHEVAPGQHEIDFKYAHALKTADNLITFRMVVRKAAFDHGLHATFMPKPVFGENGSGMHCHLSLFKGRKNAFDDPKGKIGLSRTAHHFVAGVLAHAEAITAVTNPLVNSYKRLVPGYEAPTHIAWSEKNRSPLCRIPANRGVGARMELRSPDPSCNPYLAIAVMLGAGLDGVERKLEPPVPVGFNVYAMSEEERKKKSISSLPGDLKGALISLKADKVICDVLGEHLLDYFLKAKTEEWRQYIASVSEWELDQYLDKF
jgi:glutamine synthetase